MSISTSSPYPHGPYQQVTYQQASLNFRAFMEETDFDKLLSAMPVKQNYIKMDEIEALANALLDKDVHRPFMIETNDAYAKGKFPPTIHEQVYSKPISGNLIDFNDPALKKLMGMLPIKGLEKKIVGDIEKKSVHGDLGTTIKSQALGDADGFVTNIEPYEYNFVAEDGMISSLYFGQGPKGLDLMSSKDYDLLKMTLMTRIYKLLRIAYDGLLIGATDKANKEWAKLSRFDFTEYSKTITAQRAVADALRAQIKLIIKKNNTNLEEAFKIAFNVVRTTFFSNDEHFFVGRFISQALKSLTDSTTAEKLSKIFVEFNVERPAMVYQQIDVQDIQKLAYMFKTYIKLLKS